MIIQNMSSECNRIKLEINSREKTGESWNTWKLSSTLIHNPWVKEAQRILKLNESENKTFHNGGMELRGCERKIYYSKCLC